MLKTALPRLSAASGPLKSRLHVPGALKYPDFRNYWFGMVASVTGYQMLVLFSLGWLIRNELTGDTRYLGYMSTAIAVPAILLNLFGGVLADKLNPKRLMGLTQTTTAVIVFGLAMLTVRNVVNEWHVLIAAFLIGAVQALDTPARQSVFPRLIQREALFNAVALNSSVWTGTRIFAPALAGVIVGLADISMGIFVSAAGFLVLGIISYTLRPSPVEPARGNVFKGMMEGFSFIRGTPIFSILIGTTFFNAMFGMSYVFLMPAFAEEVLDIGPGKLGLLIGAAGLGALTGILISANLSSVRHKGWILIGGVTFFGIFLILFGILANAGQYELSMVALFLGDMGGSIYLMMVITTLQSRVPDQIRGRVMGFYSITWSLIPLGGLQASQVAHYTSAPIAVIIGGALVVAFAIGIALTSRRVRTLGSSDEEI